MYSDKILNDRMVLKHCNFCIQNIGLDCDLCKDKDIRDLILAKQQSSTLVEYQNKAEVTMKKNRDMKTSLCDYGLGITGESGEVADIIKKGVFHGHTFDKEELINELGDVLWYVSAIASTIDISLDVIANTNINKLKNRYPEGFEESRSINRE